MLPRVDRSIDICQRLVAMTRFKWKSDIPGAGLEDARETGGPMFPVNCRVREGILQVPSVCLKNIIDENPIFLSRICKAPCSIAINIVGSVSGSHSKNVEIGNPVDISARVEIAKWLSDGILGRTDWSLNFYCARRNSSSKGNESPADGGSDYVWIGQIRKALLHGERSSENPHEARLIFLNEGDYFVSAAIFVSVKENNDDVKEVWWAGNAGKIHVSRCKKCQ